MSKHPLARRARRLAARTSARRAAYGDGMFFFTRPVGAPMNYPEGQGENRNMSPRGEFAVTTGYTSGGEFLGDYYADGANTRPGGYGDGGFYFLQKFGQPVGGYGDVAMLSAPSSYGDVAMDEPQVIRMGFAGFVSPEYGAAGNPRGMTGVRPGVSTRGPDVKAASEERRPGRSEQGSSADAATYDITPNVLPEYIDALKALGKAEYWKDFWGRARGVRRPPGYSDESEKQYEVANTTYNTARGMAAVKEAAYVKGLPKADAFGRALDVFRGSYTRKGWLDEAFRNVDESGRKASPSVVDAIKRDVFEAYANEVLGYEDALLMAKRYIYGSVMSDWAKSKMEAMLPAPGPSSDSRYETKYGVLKSGTVAYMRLKSYPSGPEWFYPISTFKQSEAEKMTRSQFLREHGSARRYVRDDRWKYLFGKLFTSSLSEEITSRRTALETEKTALDAKLTSLQVDLGDVRTRTVAAVAALAAAARTVASAKTTASTAAQRAQVSADAAKGKRTEAETKALGLDVAGTEAAAAEASAAATQADTYAKQAEATLSATAAAFRLLGDAGKTDKTSINATASAARTSATNAGIDAQSAVARIEVAKAAKKAADDKAAADAAKAAADTAAGTVTVAQQAVDVAQRNLDTAKARLAQGQGTQADVDAAQRALDEANARLAMSKTEAGRLAAAAAQAAATAQASADNVQALTERAETLGSKVPPGAVQPRGRGPTKVAEDKTAQAGGEGFFSKYSTELILGGAVLAIGGYFAWQKYGKK